MNGNALSPDDQTLIQIAPSNRISARFFSLLVTALSIYSIPLLFQTGALSGNFIGTYSSRWTFLLALTVFLVLVELFLLFFAWFRPQVLNRWTVRCMAFLSRLKWGNLAGFALAWVVYVLFVLYRFEKQFVEFTPRVWLFWLAACCGALFVMGLWKRIPFFWAVLASAVLYGAGVRALGFLPEITNFPFSLSWSEASRYYYASLPYSQNLYGISIPLTPMHPSRYLLMGLPFILPETSLWVHRFWQVLLWLALSFGAGLALVRRFRFSLLAGFVFAFWAFLFLLQGPVYYHLEVCVILVFLGFQRRRFWRTTAFIVLASIWAGISRVNWIPVPAFLAAAIYFLERPYCEVERLKPARRALSYLWPPFVWGAAGLAAALASQAAYMLVSGYEDTSAFASSFTSDLLWYRLLPSPTYAMGVFPTILLVTAPALVLVIGSWIAGRQDWHPLRLLGLAVILLTLFAGGLVVSTKIGGGSNIHNLDSFIILVLVMSSYVLLGHYASETTRQRVWRPWGLVFFLAALPVMWNLNIGDPFIKRNFQQANYDLGKLAAVVDEYSSQGEVLFITQRQLVMFGLISGVRIIPDYELLTLSEMSISNNQAYLNRFYGDLRSHRFALIVADRQSLTEKNPAVDPFAEENNAWVENIAKPILKYYKSKKFMDTQGIDLLIPRQ
jgi:hypothetical protein